MKLQVRASLALSVLALVAALGGVGGAVAGQALITSKQIKNGTIRAVDLHKGAVRTGKIRKGAVKSSSIGTNAVRTAAIAPEAVGPTEVDMPVPEQLVRADAAAVTVGAEYALVAVAGAFVKEDPASTLQVEWSGSAFADDLPCVFQLRVDGAAAGSAGEVPVQVKSTSAIAASALFEGLAVGEHSIEVWARTVPNSIYSSSRCVVGPGMADVAQTYVVSERVG